MSPDLSTSLLHAACGGGPVPGWAGPALQLATAAVAFVPLISAVGMLGIWAERKISARIQSRIGPNRVGPFGLWQSIADGAKLLMKEDLVPGGPTGGCSGWPRTWRSCRCSRRSPPSRSGRS